jgi:hypothetical protein
MKKNIGRTSRFIRIWFFCRGEPVLTINEHLTGVVACVHPPRDDDFLHIQGIVVSRVSGSLRYSNTFRNLSFNVKESLSFHSRHS